MTAPALAVAHPKYGRLYRWPGSDLPETMRKGQMDDALRAGLLVPSVTNVIGIRDKEYLRRWYARLAADAAIQVLAKHPQHVTERPADARRWIAEAAERSLADSQDRGTRVHDACEAIARGLPCPPLEGDEPACVESWKAFLSRWQPDWMHLEATCFGEVDGLRYAGTADFLARFAGLPTLGDYKTNRHGLHGAEVGSQLAALAHAQRLVLDDGTLVAMPEVLAGVAVHLNPEGYQVAPVDLDGPMWPVFRHSLAMWAEHVTDGDGTLSGTKALGVPLRGPEALRPSPLRAGQAATVR